MPYLKRLIAWLNRPVFGTRVIPPGARVDPDRFADAEFPVHCPTCDYCLQGLPSCRCPECGRPFDRGRLLVEQYVLDTASSPWRRNRLSRALKWMALCALALLTTTQVLIVGTPWLVQRYKPRAQAAGGTSKSVWDQVQRVSQLAEVVNFVMLAMLVTGVGMGLWRYRQFAAKRRCVLAAIEEGQGAPAGACREGETPRTS
ncbi:MAG: hypothetical protein AMXMBFR13_25540 [Phycisphaerae bacterium]